MSFTPDLPSTEDVLAAVLSSSTPPLPPSEQLYGATTVSWWETDPGQVYVHAEGGSADDRHYARTLIATDLEGHGYRRAHFDFDASVAPEPPNYRKATDEKHCGGCKMFDKGACWGFGNKQVKRDFVCDEYYPEGKKQSSLSKTAEWADLMAKAKRLLQSGQVHVLRNGFNYIVGHVVGDHGEYDTELSRDDPNGRAITSWQCSCPWDQYAWQRTRKWKKFEGRPCSHVLALYWKALSTPMDEQLTPEQAEAMGTGQKLPAPPVAEHPPEIEKDIMQGEKHQDHIKGPDTHNFGLPRSFSPEGDIIQGDQLDMATGQPGPAQAPMAPPPPEGPVPPGILPPFPGEQMQMQWGGPGTTPGGGASPPGAYTVPGAKPQTPANPIQNPSTYSKVAHDWQTGLCDAYALALLQEHPELRLGGAGDEAFGPQHWFAHDDTHAYDSLGAHPLPYHGVNNQFDQVWSDEDPDYWGLPENGGPEDIERARQEIRAQGLQRTSADFNAPEVVKLKNDVVGLAQGPVPGQYGDGEYREVPATKPNGQPQLAEVVHQDPTTGWIECLIQLEQSGEHEPYHVRAYLEPGDIEKTDQTNAFIRRR